MGEQTGALMALRRLLQRLLAAVGSLVARWNSSWERTVASSPT
jgi:hypothetical protein